MAALYLSCLQLCFHTAPLTDIIIVYFLSVVSWCCFLQNAQMHVRALASMCARLNNNTMSKIKAIHSSSSSLGTWLRCSGAAAVGVA